jgi:hypothetical protein
MPRPGIKFGCAVVVLFILAYAAVGLSNTEWMGGGDRSIPNLSVERTLTANVDLDAAHPSAIQRFTIESAAAGQISLRAHANPGIGVVSLTLLTSEGTGSSEAWNYFKGGSGNDVEMGGPSGTDVDLSHQFMALVELVDPSPVRAVPVELTITARSDFVGTLATPYATPTLPSEFNLSVVAAGPISTAGVSRIRASYQETIQVTGGPSHRVLRLAISGAALPVSAGGSGRPLIVATVIAYAMPGSGGEMNVHGAIQPGSIPIAWNFSGTSDERYADTNRGSGGDMSAECPNSGGSCQVDLSIDLETVGNVWSTGSASPENAPMTVTFEVDAIDFLIGEPVVPAGASISLTSL